MSYLYYYFTIYLLFPMRNLKVYLLKSLVLLIRCCPIFMLQIGNLSASFGQTIYYVANSGNDSNTGRSIDNPYQTVAKINSLSLQPGDQVLFRRNDTFRGSLQLRQSGSSGNPIVIDAYGSGNKPILAGSVAIGNWASIGNNIWQATCSACSDRVTGLYRDNLALPLGRFPNLSDSNKGYLTVQSHAGKTQLTSQQSLPTNWTGGEAVFRPVQWILNRATITGQSGNTLTLNGSGSYDVSDNWGYFIQNHPATLDQRGEWYYNPANKTIQLYDNQSSPNSQAITVTANNEAVNLSDLSFVSVRNLQLTQTLSTGLLITNSSNVVIANNDITQSGEDGISIQGNGNQVLLESNLIENANNNGVTIATYQNVTFRGNTIRAIGLIPGRGKSGDGTYVGFQSACTANTLIENNILDNIGYNALNFSTSTTIQRNQISNFCLTKSDGSGLYIWNGNQQPLSDIHLLSNVVYNGVGAQEGSPSGTSAAANGIYLDDCTANIEVANNSVYNCAGLGVYLHGSSSIRLTGNTVYNNGGGQLAITSANGCQPRNNVIQNNIFVSRLAGQYNVKYESDQNDLGSYGQFDNNVYCRPFEDISKILAVYNRTTGAALSLARWQSQYSKDMTSMNSPLTYSSGNPDDYINHNANPTASARQVTLTGTYRDMRNNIVAGQISIPAFSSVVLLKDAATPLRSPENPANAVAGLDYKYYEGSWSSLPDFNNLTPVKTDVTATPTIGPRKRDNAYGLRFVGYVSVPADGVYTFYTSSDDGTKLLIGNTEVVTNDGVHGDQEKSGTIGLKAGMHALTIVYFQGDGGQSLSVSYSGPGIGKQTIPATAFFRVAVVVPLRDPENPATAVVGLDYKYYEGSWSSLPDFNNLNPVKTDVTSAPTIGVRSRDNSYGLRFTGYISVPTDGVYTFYTTSDDGTKLLIGTTEVVTNDGVHGDQEGSGTIGLKAGVHALTIVYFQGNGGQSLSVSYSGPGIGKQTIPAGAFRRVSTGTTTGSTTAGNGAGLRAEYFNNISLTAPVVLTRTDATINFDWGSGSPAGGTINTDNFSARWTGQVEAPVTGNYTFSTVSDDGVRLWVNGIQLINNWNGHAAITDNGTPMALTGGQKYDIRMEYYEGGGGAVAKLLWAYSGQTQQVVPQDRLYPDATTAFTSTGTYLSDLNWTSATSGYGPVEKDRSNGESGGNDGRVLTLNGVTYAKGLGVHAPSEVIYNLGGQYTNFSTDIGIDDEIGNGSCGTVSFDIYVDNVLVYSSGTMTPATATKSVSLNVSGKQTLKLVVTTAGDNYNCDHADWAGARLTGSGSARIANLSEEVSPNPVFQIYPMPAYDEIQIRYYADRNGEAMVQLVNVSAQAVKQANYPVVKGENMIKVPVGDLSRGGYVLTLTQDLQRLSRKVLLIE